MATEPHPWRYYVLLVLAACFGGGNVVAGKLAVGLIDPSTLVVLRWVGALIAVLPLAAGPLRTDWPVVRHNWWLYLLYGSIGFAGFTILVYIASHLTSGVNIALEQVTINIFVMLINFLIFRIRVKSLQLLGVGLTAIGVALVATRGDLTRIFALDINVGDAMMLVACFCNAAYIALLRFRPKTDLRSFLCACFAGALLASLLYAQIAIGLDVLVGRLSTLSLAAWLIVAYAAFFPSLVRSCFTPAASRRSAPTERASSPTLRPCRARCCRC